VRYRPTTPAGLLQSDDLAPARRSDLLVLDEVQDLGELQRLHHTSLLEP